MKRYSAFSLAEVLITLGIICVVAALTIPSLISKYHRRVAETKLVKFESVINQAVRMSIAENDDIVYNPPSTGDTSIYLKEWFNENLLKYMNANYDGDVIKGQYYKVTFLDGTGFVAYINSNGPTLHFFYCLNAGDKSCQPESYDGKNTFVFNYYPNKKAVLPFGAEDTDINYLKYNPSRTGSGCYIKDRTTRHHCAQLIRQNGWKIPNDYPWIK